MIFIANDHAGYEMAELIKAEFDKANVLYEHIGAKAYDKGDNYVFYTFKANKRVLATEGSIGIYLCGTGIGTSIAANRSRKIRAALCHNSEFATLSRLHNNANVLVLPARYLEINEAMDIINTFINTGFEGGRHVPRIDMLDE